MITIAVPTAGTLAGFEGGVTVTGWLSGGALRLSDAGSWGGGVASLGGGVGLVVLGGGGEEPSGFEGVDAGGGGAEV